MGKKYHFLPDFVQIFTFFALDSFDVQMIFVLGLDIKRLEVHCVCEDFP